VEGVNSGRFTPSTAYVDTASSCKRSTIDPEDPNIKTTMCSLVDDRRDEFTASNLAHSIAGYFDARFTRA
jgi:hypothetical protein